MSNSPRVGSLWPAVILAAVVAVISGLLVAAPAVLPSRSGAAEAAQWRPPIGPVFNNPAGKAKARQRVVQRIKDAIAHTPKGETIRISTYSFDLEQVGKLLVKAHNRGVHVQVLANDNYVSGLEKRLQRRFGKNVKKPTFLRICKGSCRGSGSKGNLHIKIASFTRTGSARNVIISTSGNLSHGGVNAQWNDGYTLIGKTDLFKTWVKLFNQLKLDKKASPRYVSYSSARVNAAFQRKLARAQGGTVVARKASSDSVVSRLRKIGCAAPKGYGVKHKTAIRINMRAWYGNRGLKIAAVVAKLKKKGCTVKVIGSGMSAPVRKRLTKVGIPVRYGDWDYGHHPSVVDEDNVVYGARCYDHLKYMTVNGKYSGKGTRSVWTGSENWSAPSLGNDEVVFRFPVNSYYRAYLNRFNLMWGNHNMTHPVGQHPTRRPCH